MLSPMLNADAFVKRNMCNTLSYRPTASRKCFEARTADNLQPARSSSIHSSPSTSSSASWLSVSTFAKDSSPFTELMGTRKVTEVRMLKRRLSSPKKSPRESVETLFPSVSSIDNAPSSKMTSSSSSSPSTTSASPPLVCVLSSRWSSSCARSSSRSDRNIGTRRRELSCHIRVRLSPPPKILYASERSSVAQIQNGDTIRASNGYVWSSTALWSFDRVFERDINRSGANEISAKHLPSTTTSS
mmetsp:Transcript_24468/g.79878  ORF Transcript_24468/g.79878 Transcript_24468/m.79878 type:complete len:244 (+) Transcript_24468:1130-1861(+)